MLVLLWQIFLFVHTCSYVRTVWLGSIKVMVVCVCDVWCLNSTILLYPYNIMVLILLIIVCTIFQKWMLCVSSQLWFDVTAKYVKQRLLDNFLNFIQVDHYGQISFVVVFKDHISLAECVRCLFFLSQQRSWTVKLNSKQTLWPTDRMIIWWYIPSHYHIELIRYR